MAPARAEVRIRCRRWTRKTTLPSETNPKMSVVPLAPHCACSRASRASQIGCGGATPEPEPRATPMCGRRRAPTEVRKRGLTQPSKTTMQKISFSFGRNWNRYVRTVDDAKIAGAVEDIRARLGTGVRGKCVVDVGCGSGIHSLAFRRLGASRVVSFDADPHSVTATTTLWNRENRPSSWEVRPGSILDPRMIASLGQFDVVYSWGVLHHTGAMWQAIENAAKLVAVGGAMWIALYVAGPRYERDLAVKRTFNAAADPVKWAIVAREVLRAMYGNALQHKNPLAWNRQKERGMSVYYDIWDWLGGLPYEVASREEVGEFLTARGFESEGFEGAGEGCCANYLYRRRA